MHAEKSRGYSFFADFLSFCNHGPFMMGVFTDFLTFASHGTLMIGILQTPVNYFLSGTCLAMMEMETETDMRRTETQEGASVHNI